MSENDKSGYFKMSKAVDELSYSFGAKEKAVAGLKLFGKGLFNVARYAVTEVLPEVTIKTGEKRLKNGVLTNDEREKLEERIEKAKNFKDKMSSSSLRVNKSIEDEEY